MAGIEGFDAVIVGGGPAGSTLALRLARAGLNVLLVEGKRFPRPHIGESLLAMSMPYLREMGLETALEEAGFIRKSGAIFVWAGIERHLPMPPPGNAFQVSRDRLDDILLRKAKEAGATIWTGCWARRVVCDASGRITGVVIAGARQETVRTRILADASGLARFLQHQLELGETISGPPRAAVVMYASDADRYDAPFAGDIVTEAAADGWIWFIPLSDTVTSVGFVGDLADIDGPPDAVMERQIASSRVVRRLLAPSAVMRRPRVLHYTNAICTASLWSRGYVLVGDAAMFVDPLFSTGVHAGLVSAAQAAAGILSLREGRLTEEDAATTYDRRMRAHYARVDATVRVLYGLHSGSGAFWQRRCLDDLSTDAAEQLVRDLGVTGMQFFQGVLETPSIPLPRWLSRLSRDFVTTVRPQALPGDAVLELGPGVAVSTDWGILAGRMVPVVTAAHAAQRTISVEYPDGSADAALLRGVNGRTTLGAICDGANLGPAPHRRARWLAGALVAAGVLRCVA